MAQGVEKIVNAMVSLNKNEVVRLTEEAIKAQIPPQEILEKGLLQGLLVVGDKWQKQEYFISHVLMAALILRAGTDIVKPYLVAGQENTIGTVVIGTVAGDIHDIGKNLVITMLKANGFKVYDLGVDIPADQFIEKAKEVDADIIACAIVMSVCIPVMEEVVKLTREAGLKAKVMIGGAPITQPVFEKIGADGWGEDAPEAAKAARKLLGVN